MADTRGLAARYRDYLVCLNERRFDDLPEFVHPDLVHNGRALGSAGFRAMLEADAETIPDLHFGLELLTVEAPHVASTLAFRCTPRSTFRGLPATGRPISFTEHAFYRFDEGRIAQVWSLLDLQAVRDQLLS